MKIAAKPHIGKEIDIMPWFPLVTIEIDKKGIWIVIRGKRIYFDPKEESIKLIQETTCPTCDSEQWHFTDSYEN